MRTAALPSAPAPPYTSTLLALDAILVGSKKKMPPPDVEAPFLPPREQWHQTLDVPAETPVAIIGDTHGCAAEFRALLALLPAGAVIVMVGDIVNKGPANLECLRLARFVGGVAPGGCCVLTRAGGQVAQRPRRPWEP